MQQLLSGLEHCHSCGVLHRDIKGANLLLDNNGILKIADFGLATLFNPNQKQNLTSRVVTLWYRPPELLLGATNYGAAVDLWSAGCILAELLSGKPIMPGRTEVMFDCSFCDAHADGCFLRIMLYLRPAAILCTMSFVNLISCISLYWLKINLSGFKSCRKELKVDRFHI
jgi:serine/threonine protein kinase